MTTSTTSPLHSYMRTLLEDVIIEEANESSSASAMYPVDVAHVPSEKSIRQEQHQPPQIISDNAFSPTRSLRMRQRRLNQMRRIHRSYSEIPSSSTSHSRREPRRWTQEGGEVMKSYSFQAPSTPIRKESAIWYPSQSDEDDDDEHNQQSPCSVQDLIKVASPRTARWHAKSSTHSNNITVKDYSMSPKSARWSPSPPCFVRQVSENDLVCPQRQTSLDLDNGSHHELMPLAPTMMNIE